MGQKVTKMAYFGSFLTTFWTTLFIFIYVCLILGVNCVHIWVKHEKRAKKGSKSGSKMGHFGCPEVRGTPKSWHFAVKTSNLTCWGVKKWPIFGSFLGQKVGSFLDPLFSTFGHFVVEARKDLQYLNLAAQKVVQKWSKNGSKNGSKMGHFRGSKNDKNGKNRFSAGSADRWVASVFLSRFLVILPYFAQVATCGFWPKIGQNPEMPFFTP